MSRLGYQCLWVRTCGFPLSVVDNENWVGPVAVLTSLRVEDWRIMVGFPARVKTLSVVQNPKPSLHSPVILFREKKGLFPRGFKGWGVKMTNYLYPARRQRSYSLPNNPVPNNFIPCTETSLALIRIKCGRNKEEEEHVEGRVRDWRGCTYNAN